PPRLWALPITKAWRRSARIGWQAAWVSRSSPSHDRRRGTVQLTEVRNVLEARRRQLAAELAELTKPPEAGSNLSFGKRIGEGTTEAVERISSTAAARSAAALASVD